MRFNLGSFFGLKRAGKPSMAVLADARFREGLALHQSGQLAKAKAVYEEVLKMQPSHADALHLLGVAAYQNNDNLLAVAQFDKAVAIDPENPAAYSNRGLALQALKRFDEAIASYSRAITLKADFAEAYFNRGNTLKSVERLEDALADYDQVVRFKADFPDAHNNRGVTLQALRQLDEALLCYDHAIRLKPDYAEAHSNRGATLHALGRYEAALESYDRAIEWKPDYAEAHNNRGVTLKALHRLDEALASYGRAIKYQAHYADAYCNRGVTLQAQRRLDDALASYDHAIKLSAGHAEAYINRGNVLTDLNRLDDASVSYEHALGLKPEHDYLYGTCLHAKMKLCDWNGVGTRVEELLGRIQRNAKAASPFVVLTLTDSPSVQRRAAEIWTNHRYPASRTLPTMRKHARRGKIRIGYYSADFRLHAVSILMAGVFEMHDKSQFECTAFSYGPDTKDELRARAERAFDHFVDVRSMLDREIAELSREMDIDIAIDLGGGTQNARMGIFALRAAPVQVSYIGYLGTMGASYIDYLIADKCIIPEQNRPYYLEKIVYLPSYQANDSLRRISDRRFDRTQLGLPATGFVFCCFNNNYKITPATFDVWMRILKRVNGSILWLYADNEWAKSNLMREAVFRGVEPSRLVFAGRLPPAEYLARFRVADLFLDTLPYNAGTTASDALWAGLPVLTCAGDAFAARVAASLLSAVGLPDLVSTTVDRYEALAVELAENEEMLQAIRQALERKRLTAPLFDTASFTRNLERGYLSIYERYQADLPPDDIVVTS